jgi:ribosome maturation factor RimP
MTSNLIGRSHLLCSTQLEIRIYELLEKSLESLDLIIVQIKIGKSGQKLIPQIMIEKISGEAASMEDCEKAIRQISTVLSVEDPFKGEDYNIEVLSTGINRPLTRLEDFTKFIGQKIRVRTTQKLDGSRNFSGILNGMKPDGKVFIMQNGESIAAIELARVQEAYLDVIFVRHHQKKKS